MKLKYSPLVMLSCEAYQSLKTGMFDTFVMKTFVSLYSMFL